MLIVSRHIEERFQHGPSDDIAQVKYRQCAAARYFAIKIGRVFSMPLIAAAIYINNLLLPATPYYFHHDAPFTAAS